MLDHDLCRTERCAVMIVDYPETAVFMPNDAQLTGHLIAEQFSQLALVIKDVIEIIVPDIENIVSRCGQTEADGRQAEDQGDEKEAKHRYE